MNRIKQIFSLAIGLSLLVSCVDLDTAPQGGTVTSEQKQMVAEMNPAAIEAELAGLSTSMFGSNNVYAGGGRADDFGFPACALSWDCQSADMASPDDGYNWFSVACSYENRTYTYANTRLQWDPFYKNIYIANNIIKTIPADVEGETTKAYRGIALAFRAWDYMNLVQNFQFKYKGHESDPSVPLVTEETTAEQAAANPRAAVSDVYDLIMSDLNESVALLETYDRGSDKTMPDKSVVLGLRARANLLMENWSAAAADAAAARQGYGLLSKDGASKPGFNDADDSNWMWALIIGPDQTNGDLASWPSQLSSLTGYGYTTAVAVWRTINVLLYSKIPAADVRKTWWVDENLHSDMPSYPAGYGNDWGFNPYTNIKFANYSNDWGIDDTNGGDWCIMRAEEMLLIEAEAKAMSGDLAGAKSLLQDWVTTYRNPEYQSYASTAAEFQNEVWFQRRVELWGEGFGFFDLQRLNKHMVRFNTRIPDTNHDDNFRFNLANDHMVRLLTIPQREINANNGIDESDNNPGQSLIPIGMGAGAGLLDGVTD